ncbi:MAG: GNAT family N-acetyltransferase, partial [Gemmatimonadota bacterium]
MTPGAQVFDQVARTRFLAVGPELRSPEAHDATPSPGYGARVLDLLEDRPYSLLVAETGGRPVARAVVTVRADRSETGLLGLDEAGEGPDGDHATRSLLAEASDWCRERGLRRILAPVDGNSWMAYRFRLPDPAADAHGARRSFAWEPRHPPRYLERFLVAGFHETLRFETVGLVFPQDGPYRLADAAAQTRPAAEAAAAAGYGFRCLRRDREELSWPALHRLTARAFAPSPLFQPIPLQLFQGLYQNALGAAAADFTHWIRDPWGRLCAVMFAFRDGDSVILKSVAVDPDHQGRHLSTALVHRVL